MGQGRHSSNLPVVARARDWGGKSPRSGKVFQNSFQKIQNFWGSAATPEGRHWEEMLC